MDRQIFGRVFHLRSPRSGAETARDVTTRRPAHLVDLAHAQQPVERVQSGLLQAVHDDVREALSAHVARRRHDAGALQRLHQSFTHHTAAARTELVINMMPDDSPDCCVNFYLLQFYTCQAR